MTSDIDTPISDYALVGDMRSCALVGKDGSVDWFCLPRHDSPALFLRLLDPRGGCCRIEVHALRSTARRYLPETNILETTFHAATGTLVVRDFMPVRARALFDEVDAGSSSKSAVERNLGAASDRNAVGCGSKASAADGSGQVGPDTEAPGALVRTLRCAAGTVAVRVVVRPTFDYARRETAAAPETRLGAVFRAADPAAPDTVLRLGSSHAVTVDDGEAVATFDLAEGDQGHVVLSGAETPTDTVEAMFGSTLAYWQAWSDRCTYRGAHRDAVQRSALCLKLLTYAPTGAIVAAATAGLPEAVGGPRNWDYRFTWLRDASFTVGAFLNLGYRREAAEFLRFLREADRSNGRDLRILYPIAGVDAPEEALEHLRGWRASRPVMIGNAAADQDQHDIYGEFLSALRLYLDEVGDDIPEAVRDHLPDLVRNLAEAVERRWMQPDRGIWELRSEPGHLFHSKGMCWLALDCAAHIAPRLGISEEERARWLALRDRIGAEVHDKSWDAERRAYVAGYELRELDAAVLRCTLFGANDPGDSRLRDTVAAIERELAVGPHVYRYRMDDGLEGDEGAFFACSFWLAGNWALQGRTLDARRRLAELVACANDVGLLSEEVDPRTGAFLGNFPQGFSHMALINGLVRLEKAVDRFGLL